MRPPSAGFAVPLPATATWRELAAEFSPAPCEAGRLSPAEEVVCAHVRQGLSNREIATALRKSPATVKGQLSSVYRKLHIPGRVQLILMFHR